MALSPEDLKLLTAIGKRLGKIEVALKAHESFAKKQGKLNSLISNFMEETGKVLQMVSSRKLDKVQPFVPIDNIGVNPNRMASITVNGNAKFLKQAHDEILAICKKYDVQSITYGIPGERTE